MSGSVNELLDMTDITNNNTQFISGGVRDPSRQSEVIFQNFQHENLTVGPNNAFNQEARPRQTQRVNLSRRERLELEMPSTS